jgi:GxxExxY protein
LSLERQVNVPLLYKGNILATPLRLDLLVSEKVIVECKSMVTYNSIFESQLLTYLRLTGLKLGLVVNFGDFYVSKGIHRVANNL